MKDFGIFQIFIGLGRSFTRKVVEIPKPLQEPQVDEAKTTEAASLGLQPPLAQTAVLDAQTNIKARLDIEEQLATDLLEDSPSPVKEIKPAFCISDFDGKPPRDIASQLTCMFMDELIKKSGEGFYRPVSFLGRIEMSEKFDLSVLARGDRSNSDNQDRKKYYSGIEVNFQIHCEEMERLLLSLGIETALAVELTRILTDFPSYKKQSNGNATVSVQPKVKNNNTSVVDPEQALMIDSFVRVTGDKTAYGFLVLSGNHLHSSLKVDEFNRRIRFLIELVIRKPGIVKPVYKGEGTSLIDQYKGYLAYTESPNSVHKEIAEDFLSCFNDFRVNNYLMRARIVDFLNRRILAGDEDDAIKFLKTLEKLVKDYGIQGIERLFVKAHKHSMKPQSVQKEYGYYFEADSALSLLEKPARDIRLQEISVKDIDGSYVDDVDIVAEVNEVRNLIEVKSTAFAAASCEEQIDALVRNANKYNSVPVLLIGNIHDILDRVTRELRSTSQIRKDFLANNSSGSLNRSIVQLEILNAFLTEHGDALRIWDNHGNDLTENVVSLFSRVKSIIK